jgi:predicted nucleic acid-binding Zn ribbon protein
VDHQAAVNAMDRMRKEINQVSLKLKGGGHE